MHIFPTMHEEPMKNIDRRGAMIRGKEIHHEAVVKVQKQAVAEVLMGGKLHLDNYMRFEKKPDRRPRLKVA